MPTPLEGKAVLILGGSSGIGLATANAALSEGAHVTITGRSNDKLKGAATELGSAAITVQLDATDEPATQAFFASLTSLDHLFITAGAFISESPTRTG